MPKPTRTPAEKAQLPRKERHLAPCPPKVTSTHRKPTGSEHRAANAAIAYFRKVVRLYGKLEADARAASRRSSLRLDMLRVGLAALYENAEGARLLNEALGYTQPLQLALAVRAVTRLVNDIRESRSEDLADYLKFIARSSDGEDLVGIAMTACGCTEPQLDEALGTDDVLDALNGEDSILSDRNVALQVIANVGTFGNSKTTIERLLDKRAGETSTGSVSRRRAFGTKPHAV